MAEEDLPRAELRPRRSLPLVWLTPLLAIALTLYIVFKQLPERGPEIDILLDDASGIQVKQTAVQYRGVVLGLVEAVELDADSGRARVRAAMSAEAEALLRSGSRFWVVRPRLGFAEVEALGTLISGPYIALQPGDGEPATRFEALAEAPPPRRDDGLNIVLLSPRLGSLRLGTPITYRGVRIGEISQYALQSDSRRVRLQAHIEAPYLPLVRNDSVFWRSGGLDLDIGLFGAEASLESLSALLNGGIAMATPDAASPPAQEEWHFVLHERAEDVWEEWSPAIDITAPPARPEPDADARSAVLQGLEGESAAAEAGSATANAATESAATESAATEEEEGGE